MKIRVSFDINIPDEYEDCHESIEEFLRFEYRDNGVMSGDNPLRNEIVEPIYGTFEWDYV